MLSHQQVIERGCLARRTHGEDRKPLRHERPQPSLAIFLLGRRFDCFCESAPPIVYTATGHPLTDLSEDGGPGVPEDALPRLFEKFYRVPGGPRGSRTGTGIGLAVVQGLLEATGGRCAARRSELGDLAIDLDLPVADVPAGLLEGVGA